MRSVEIVSVDEVEGVRFVALERLSVELEHDSDALRPASQYGTITAHLSDPVSRNRVRLRARTPTQRESAGGRHQHSKVSYKGP